MALCLAAAAGFVRLGLWQLDRLDVRRAANVVAHAARTAPVLELTGGTAVPADSLEERRVTARGRYDHAHDIVLRGRAYQGVPGVYLVSPLRLAGRDTAVLVERGFVPAPDAVTADPGTFAEPGDVVVKGLARTLRSGGGNPMRREGRTTWARLDPGALGDSLPYPILSISIRQTPDPSLPSFPRRLEPPPIDDGPHLNYAIQWFLFAALAAAFAFLVIGRREKSRSGT